MIELKKTKTAKDKVKKHPLYRWARLIAATTWEEVAQESAGNRYMEKIADDLMEDIVVIKKIYEIVKENTKATADEIYQKIN